MASSTYKNLTPAAKLDKKTLNKIAWKSTMLQASFNYERMQAAGWLWTILPGLEKIHTDKEDLSASMTHNLEFFNTHPFLITFVAGIVLSLEEQKADINTIRGVRVAAMGPLGGIGDAIFWFTLIPIASGITSQFAFEGNLLGPILFFVVVFGVQMALRIWLMNWSYKLGSSAIGQLTKHAKEFTHAASLLGVFVVGALTANYGGTAVRMMIPNGETAVEVEKMVVKGGEVVVEKVSEMQKVFIDVQKLLDGILPKAIPLAITLMCFFLIKKKNWSALKLIGLLLVIGLIGTFFGIWAGDYIPFFQNLPW